MAPKDRYSAFIKADSRLFVAAMYIADKATAIGYRGKQPGFADSSFDWCNFNFY